MRKHNGLRFREILREPPAASSLFEQPPGKLPSPATTTPGCGVSTDIRVATLTDLRYVLGLQKKFSNELGFLPRPALEEYLTEKRVGIAFENGEPAGYVLGRDRYRMQPLLRPICQAAVQFDAQRRHHGIALVERVIARARAAGQSAVQAVCAGDIEANQFWKALGFEQIDAILPDNARGRVLIIWRKLVTDVEPSWFWTGPKHARNRGTPKGQ